MPIRAHDLARRCAIAMMAKAPQAGRSKTRLCPPLAFDEAAALSGAFLRDMSGSIAVAAGSAPIDGFVAYAPAGTEAELELHLAPGTRLLLADGGDVAVAGVHGFGRVLLQTMRTLLGMGYGGVCVLNSDSPTLAPEILVSAADGLLTGNGTGVFGASSDGGYYLLGLTGERAAVFTEIDWSSERVAGQTREQARRCGLDLVELPEWYDVDDASALRRLLHELDDPAMAARAPVTRSTLERMMLEARLGISAVVG